MFSILILTKNEEVNIEQCIKSCRESDDIVVFDSLSSDRTVEIARSLGARVFSRPFDDYGLQRESARQVDYKHSWVLSLDADERMDVGLGEEILSAIRSTSNNVAYRLRRKDYFCDRWIKHSSLYPSWFVRLYRPDCIRYEPRAVHEYPTVTGIVGELQGHLLHYSFSKGLEEWFVKHCHYAALEACENIKWRSSGIGLPWRHFVSRDPVQRRRALKALSMTLPFRPTLRFLYSYVLRLGFLDGLPGYRYAKMLAVYEQMIVIQAQVGQQAFEQTSSEPNLRCSTQANATRP